MNQRHVTEQKLNEAIDIVIDGYRAFSLPEAWGLGKTASANGTQWDLSPQNLMSEYHIRYGDWGGLGYYLVADDYIALFSRFSTYGSWEGHYILEFVTETDESWHPEIVHSDTQGQSAAIFGLAHLPGIQLLPRIRHWKDLHLYRASSEDCYEHIDELLTKEVNWELIAAFWPDMLRVAISIAEGRVTPSTVLRRLQFFGGSQRIHAKTSCTSRFASLVVLSEPSFFCGFSAILICATEIKQPRTRAKHSTNSLNGRSLPAAESSQKTCVTSSAKLSNTITS